MNRFLAIGAWSIALAGIAAQGVPSAAADPPHHKVHMEGSGSRTVVFEAGFGDTLEVWRTVQAQVAAHCAGTFSYNRAGYLDSDPASGTRDAATVVAELRDELRRQRLTPPYVLVGHSLGGLYMQYFARSFPRETAGLLLVDSTHWQQGLKIDATANTPYQARTAVTLFMPLIMRQELNDSTVAGQQVHDSPAATSVPTIVLSSTRTAPGIDEAQRVRATALQDEIAADFPGARHVLVENSGHYIQRDQPGAVVAAARELAGCRESAR